MAELRAPLPKHEFVTPPEGHTATIDWMFGNDTYTNTLGKKLNFAISMEDVSLAIQAAKREPEGLKAISDIWGRTALIPSPRPDSILNHSYNTLEVGGFGMQELITRENGFSMLSLTQPIGLPSSQNFASLYPGITHTAVVDGKNEVILGDSFSFSGAYTQKQIIRKFASNLFVLNKLANFRDVSPPFLVPTPIAIGHYPTIVNGDGECAYFGIFKVPFEGRRTGYRHLYGGNTPEVRKFADDLMEAMPAIAPALAYMSNNWGITHNQPHPSNVYIPTKEEGALPLLADFSTVYPLNRNNQEVARARELRRGINSVWRTLQNLFQDLDEDRIIGTLLRNTFQEYVGRKLYATIPTKADEIEVNLAQTFHQMILAGLLPDKLPTDESWGKILGLEKMIQGQVKKSLKQARQN